MTKQTKSKARATTADPVDLTQQRLEQAAGATRAYAATANSAALTGLRSAFALQNGAIAANQALAATAIETSQAFGKQWVEAVREGQAETAKLAQAGATLVGSTLDTSR